MRLGGTAGPGWLWCSGILYDRTCEADTSRKDAASLLGFKKTCLKVYAEVSQWTRLCELSIPSAVEAHLRQPANSSLHLSSAPLNLEKTLDEPVKVHNNNKIRQQKLQQKKKNQKKVSQDLQEDQGTDVTQTQDSQSPTG